MSTQYISYPASRSSSSVTSLNGLTGNLTLVAGTGITITPSGSDITISSTSSGSAVWGMITGTLSNQTDLQNALNLKAPLANPVFTGQVGVPSGLASAPGIYFDGDVTTGIYQPGSGDVYISGEGNEIAAFNRTDTGLTSFLYLNVAGTPGTMDIVTGNTDTDTLFLTGNQYGTTANGGGILLGSYSGANAGITQFWNGGVESASISATGVWSFLTPPNFTSPLVLTEISTPADPPSGSLSIYPKTTTAGGSTLESLDWLNHGGTERSLQTSCYLNVLDFGANPVSGHGDQTTAIQDAINYAMANGNQAVFFPVGVYDVAGPLTIGQGVALVGQESQGTNDSYGTVLYSTGAGTDLLVWDGTTGAAALAGTGGGCYNMILQKASSSTSGGGVAIHITSTADSYRPGEMYFKNVIVLCDNTSVPWTNGFVVNGTANSTAGTVGIRSIYTDKLRIAGVSSTAMILNQAVHFFGNAQFDEGNGTSLPNLLIEGGWDDIRLWNYSGLDAVTINYTSPSAGILYPSINFTGQCTSFTNSYASTQGIALVSNGNNTNSGPTISNASSNLTIITPYSVSLSTISSGSWNGTAIGAAYGGTGISSSSSTGSPTVSSGTWSISGTTGTLGNVVYSGGPTLTGTTQTANLTVAGGALVQNGTVNSNILANFTATSSSTSGSQVGVGSQPTFDTSATNYAIGFYSNPSIASGTTITNVAGYAMSGWNSVSGSTVSNMAAFWAPIPTGGSSNALITDTQNFNAVVSGSFGFFLGTTNPNYHAGPFQSASGLESTGTGSAALGSNCPAVTTTAPYKWIKYKTSDGSAVYIPAWK